MPAKTPTNTTPQLHEFEVGSQHIGISSKEDNFFGGEPALSESKHRLGEMLANHKKFRYWYDFGDDWWHEITIEKRVDANADDPPVRLLGGENARPRIAAGHGDTRNCVLHYPIPPIRNTNRCWNGWATNLTPKLSILKPAPSRFRVACAHQPRRSGLRTLHPDQIMVHPDLPWVGAMFSHNLMPTRLLLPDEPPRHDVPPLLF